MLYDAMAEHYHLIFEDWDRSILQQSKVLAALLPAPEQCGVVLDCACGIGTQAIALALHGFEVEGSDLSPVAIARAEREARTRGLSLSFRQDDMRYLDNSPKDHFGCVVAFDNALPHLDSNDDVLMALRAMRDRLRPGGLLLLSVRDYAPLIVGKPASTEPMMFEDGGLRRLVHQVWDWKDERRYTLHIFITSEVHAGEWSNRHFVGEYRAITVDEVVRLASEAGFEKVEAMPCAASHFYQPIIKAVKATN